VQEMRRRVVRHRREASAPRHDRTHAVAGGKPAPLEDEYLVVLEAIGGTQGCDRSGAFVDELAGIGHLAAAVRVERRLAQLREEGAVGELDARAELGEHVRLLVAHELASEAGGARKLGCALQIRLLPTGARDVAVLLHQLAEAVDVDGLATLLGQLDCELDRKPERGCEPERFLPGVRAPPRELVYLFHPARERPAKALLFDPTDALDVRGVLTDLR